MVAKFVLLIPLLLLSLSLHEFAHGKAADLLGDPTPKMTGRLTLNPLAHLSLLGTLVLLVTQRFGWAKPVQIDPSYFDNQKRDMMLVGLAGPTANIVLALLLTVVYKNFSFLLGNFINSQVLQIFFMIGIQLNLGLAIFNLIPVPPLDGSKILQGLLPAGKEYIMRNLEDYGPFFLLLFVFTGWINLIISPVFNIVYNLLVR